MSYERTELNRIQNTSLESNEIKDWKLNLLESSKESDRLFIAKGNKIQTIQGQKSSFLQPFSTNEINQIKIGRLGNKEMLVSVDDVGTVILYYTMELLRPIELSNQGISTWGIAIQDSYCMVAVSDNSHHIKIWNLASSIGTSNGPMGSIQVQRIKAHDHNIPSIEFSKSGTEIISCSIDGTLKIWNIETRELLYSTRADSWIWRGISVPLNEILYVKDDDELWTELKSNKVELFGLEREVRLAEVLMDEAYSDIRSRMIAGAQSIEKRVEKGEKDPGYETASSFDDLDSQSVNSVDLDDRVEEPLKQSEPSTKIFNPEDERTHDSDSNSEAEPPYQVYDDSMPNSEQNSEDSDEYPLERVPFAYTCYLPDTFDVCVYGTRSDVFIDARSEDEPLMVFNTVEGTNGFGTGLERVCFIEWLSEISTLLVATQVGRIAAIRLVQSDTMMGMVFDHIMYSNDGFHLLGFTCKKLDTSFPVYQLDILNRSGFLQTFQLSLPDTQL